MKNYLRKLKKRNWYKILMYIFLFLFLVSLFFLVIANYNNNINYAVYLKKMLWSKEGFNWTSLSTIAAIIALGISIFGFWWSYRANLKHNMFIEKLRVYREYLSNLGRSAIAKNPEEHKEIALKHLQIRQEILLFGSERVAELTSEIEPVDLSVPDRFNMYCDLINEMRDDLLDSNSKLNLKVIKNLIGEKN